MSILDAIGTLERVAFEEVYVPDLGTVIWFESDIQVETDCCDYVFLITKIYTQQIDGEGRESFLPALTETATQQAIELALRTYIDSDKGVYAGLCEMADEQGLRNWLTVAA